MKLTTDILEFENNLLKLENLHASFDYLKITIASPKRIKSWSERLLPNGEIIGEVLRPETINFRTHQPEVYGLFCEKIFGPIKDWKCKCGKYNGFAANKVCEECHVEVIESRVRRYRMGYIELTSPVTHLWYLKGTPNYLTLLLKCINENFSTTKIEKIVYFKEQFSENSLKSLHENKSKLTNELLPFFNTCGQKFENYNKIKKTSHQILTKKKTHGSESLKTALDNLDLKTEITKARATLSTFKINSINQQNTVNKLLIKRIRVLESFLATKTNPSWMILTILPVLPPTLRPLLELENGKLVAADVNEIYRLILTRNQRLQDFINKYKAPELITLQGKKLLQESVDSLIDNARLHKNKILCLNNKPLKSLTELLEGKQGRFRQSLLGKRVDYSGRSVIIVGPNLRLNECGLPYEMAIKLFEPYLINELLKIQNEASRHNTKLAQLIIKKNKPFIWTLLKHLSTKHCILLNRAPTLHRFGIQAFNPVIVLGQSIHLHPLVCTGFNADFDGDQMAVHLPLYDASQLEVRAMMRPSFNLLSQSSGDVILKPTQDMVIGCYYLTLMIKKKVNPIKKWFSSEAESLMAFYQKKIALHDPILIKYSIQNLMLEEGQTELNVQESKSLLNAKRIKIYKKLASTNALQKFYFLTNIGIFIGYSEKDRWYKITDLLLETTAGRTLFNSNFNNLIS